MTLFLLLNYPYCKWKTSSASNKTKFFLNKTCFPEQEQMYLFSKTTNQTWFHLQLHISLWLWGSFWLSSGSYGMRHLSVHMKGSTFLAQSQQTVPSRQRLEMMISSMELLLCFATGRKSGASFSLPHFLCLFNQVATHTSLLENPFVEQTDSPPSPKRGESLLEHKLPSAIYIFSSFLSPIKNQILKCLWSIPRNCWVVGLHVSYISFLCF